MKEENETFVSTFCCFVVSVFCCFYFYFSLAGPLRR